MGKLLSEPRVCARGIDAAAHSRAGAAHWRGAAPTAGVFAVTQSLDLRTIHYMAVNGRATPPGPKAGRPM
jgi:hypothetical protein